MSDANTDAEVERATLDGLRRLDITGALECIDDPLYWKYRTAFHARATAATTREEAACWRLLELLVDFSLVANDPRDAIVSSGSFGNLRFKGPHDLDAHEQDLVRALWREIADAELKARVADTAWTIGPRRHDVAEAAIDAYLASAERLRKREGWHERAIRMERALRISVGLGRKHERVERTLAVVRSAMDEFEYGTYPFLPLHMSQVLFDLRVGEPAKEHVRCRIISEEAEARGEEHVVQRYRELQAKWALRLQNREAARDARVAIAASHERDAEAAGANSEWLAACSHLEHAIEAARSAGDQKDLVARLQRRLVDGQRAAVAGFKKVEVRVDATDIADKARAAVRGRDLVDAIVELARIASPTSRARLRSQVEETAKSAVFMHIVSPTVVSTRGRTVAQIPSLATENPEERERAMRMHMMQTAAHHHDNWAVAVIDPARDQIVLEHGPQLRPGSLRAFVEHNPFVPPGREESFMRGLHAGFVGDLMSAGTMLMPQLENAIRHVLERGGTIVHSRDDEGIEREDDLGKLLDKPEAMRLFGEDLLFDLQGLLVRPVGSNLRNRVAHGLLADSEFDTPRFLYFWWMVLRLCITPMLARVASHEEPRPGSAGTEEPTTPTQDDDPV